MKITAVTATPIALPLVQPFRYRSGVQEGVNLVLFAVETDEGVTGYGESICEDPAAVVSYGRLMARAFVGRSPGDIEAIFGDLWRNGRWRVVPHFSLQILSGIESACWDALGKGLGVPASTFLGGRVHDEVDFMAFPQGDTAEELAREAAAFAAEGHRVVYIKVGREHRDDAEIVGAVREAIGPEPLLRIDPNEALGRARRRSTRSGGSRRSTSTGSSSPLRPATSPASRESGTRSRRRSPPTRRCTRPPSSAPSSSRRPRTRSCSAATSRAASGAGGRWRTWPSRTGSR